jgi:hypothetical protein
MSRGINSYILKRDRDLLASVKVCKYCGAEDRLHIEHITPLAIGGTSCIENLTKACYKCNALKSTFTIKEFYWRIEGKRDEIHGKTLSYCRRLQRGLKRNSWHQKDIDNFSKKIIEGRLMHSYYTRIINSILNRKYIL